MRVELMVVAARDSQLPLRLARLVHRLLAVQPSPPLASRAPRSSCSRPPPRGRSPLGVRAPCSELRGSGDRLFRPSARAQAFGPPAHSTARVAVVVSAAECAPAHHLELGARGGRRTPAATRPDSSAARARVLERSAAATSSSREPRPLPPGRAERGGDPGTLRSRFACRVGGESR